MLLWALGKQVELPCVSSKNGCRRRCRVRGGFGRTAELAAILTSLHNFLLLLLQEDKRKHRGSPSHPQAPDAEDGEKIPLSPEQIGTSATANQSAARRGRSRPPGPQHPPGQRSSRNSPASRVRVLLVPAAQRRPREPSKLY
ncbi:uncharacterized protein LOC119473421 [Cebus imitator]|uniref:uncharacterized protein LOC119473421 n=1 Tax=Cebus imitator TaxID=2715852 RepID=UPI00189ADC14|nr:uncharacterized protein LOC119473421 [Cebus imitator]